MSILVGAKKLNLIIGFDTVNYNLKVMRVLNNDFSSVKVDFVPVDEKHFIKGEWEQILTKGIAEYIENQHFDSTFAVRLVMPDSVIGTDVLTVPSLSRAKQAQAIDSQMKELYFFYKDYKFNKLLLTQNKSNSSYEITMINRALLNRVYKALNDCKLYVKNTTYASSAIVNSIFAIRPKTRRGSFLVVDIKPDFARVIAVSNGRTVGWKHVKFGYNVLEMPKVMIENNIVFNDIAQVAVLNAVEKAKKKKMTMMAEVDPSLVIEENALTINELNTDSEDISTEMTEMLRLQQAESETIETEVEVNVENQENAESVTIEKEIPKIKTFTRKNKRLPMFMQRPVPETQEGIAVENFRLFVKHALLMKMQIDQAGVYSSPQYVMVNMPSSYSYIIDEINKEMQLDEGIEFRYFSLPKEENVELTGHLDLFGAMYMENFNSNNNF